MSIGYAFRVLRDSVQPPFAVLSIKTIQSGGFGQISENFFDIYLPAQNQCVKFVDIARLWAGGNVVAGGNSRSFFMTNQDTEFGHRYEEIFISS